MAMLLCDHGWMPNDPLEQPVNETCPAKTSGAAAPPCGTQQSAALVPDERAQRSVGASRCRVRTDEDGRAARRGGGYSARTGRIHAEAARCVDGPTVAS